MDPKANSSTLDIDEAKGAFRKLTNDAASRKYRRRSPAGRSSSSDGSPKQDRRSSPILLKDDKRRHDTRHDRVSSRSEHGRDSDSRRYSSKSSYGYSRSDDRGGKHRGEEDRNCSRFSSWSGRESKGNVYSGYKERGGDYKRSRDYYDDNRKYNRDKSDAAGRANRDDYDDCDRRGGDRNYRDDKRDYRRSSRDRRNDHITSSEEYGGNRDDKISRRENFRQKETNKNDANSEDNPKHLNEERKKYDEGDYKELQDRFQDDVLVNRNEESTVKRPKKTGFDINGPMTGSSQGQDPLGKGDPGQAVANMSDSVGNLDAAKVAALKAAELVNKNLIGTGGMTADQKKKLLWENKKNTSAEESSHRWDTSIFPDRERQEKFNKLMGVKGDVNVEQNRGSDPLQTEKQRGLQLDLEKQYTAGLRRRDGRTVGLGL